MPELSDLNRTEIVDNLSKKLNSMNNELESTQREHCEIEKNLQSNIDLLREEKAKLDQEIKIKEKQIFENTSEIKKLKEIVEQVIFLLIWF